MEASYMGKRKTFMYIHIYFTEFRVHQNIKLFTYIYIYYRRRCVSLKFLFSFLSVVFFAVKGKEEEKKKKEGGKNIVSNRNNC